MALAFTGGGSERVDCGSGPSLDALSQWTILSLVYPTSVAAGAGGRIMDKGGGGHPFFFYLDARADGVFTVECEYATTGVNSQSATGTVTAGEWQLLGTTCDGATAARLYRGTMTAPASETGYTSQATPAGARGNDGANRLYIGNNLLFLQGFPGRIAWVGIWNRVLSLEEIQAQQLRPYPTSGCVLFQHLGLYGTGTQPDWSGGGNAGTVAGATQADHAPILVFHGRVQSFVPAGGLPLTVTASKGTNASAGYSPSVQVASNILVASRGVNAGVGYAASVREAKAAGYAPGAAAGYAAAVQMAPNTVIAGHGPSVSTGYALSVTEGASGQVVQAARGLNVSAGYSPSVLRSSRTVQASFAPAVSTGYSPTVVEGAPGADIVHAAFAPGVSTGYVPSVQVGPNVRLAGRGANISSGYAAAVRETKAAAYYPNRSTGFGLAVAAQALARQAGFGLNLSAGYAASVRDGLARDVVTLGLSVSPSQLLALAIDPSSLMLSITPAGAISLSVDPDFAS